MLNTLRSWLNFWAYIAKRFNEDGCFYRAGALAYTTLLSLVPLLAVIFTILSAFPVFKDVSQQIQNFVFKNFVPASGEIIQNYLQQFIAQTTHLSLVGSAFLIITAILLLYTVEQSFNAIWQVRTPRKGINAVILYWAVLTLTPLLIGLGFAASSYLLSLPLGITEFLLAIAPFILSILAFALLYIALPHCEVPFRYGLSGAVIAAILFEITKQGFGLYIAWFPTYKLIYGALAAIPIFFIWVYLTWLVVLFGAEVTHALMIRHSQEVKIKQ